MASTAAPSAAFLSPRPIHRPAASAAASVTRRVPSRCCGRGSGVRDPSTPPEGSESVPGRRPLHTRARLGGVEPSLLAAARDAIGFMPDDEGLALARGRPRGRRPRAAPRDRHVLREVGDLPRRRRAAPAAPCCTPSTTTAVPRRTRRAGSTTTTGSSTRAPAGWTRCRGSVARWRDAGLEDAVVAVIGSSPTVAANWATPLGLVFVDGGHAFEIRARRLRGVGALRRARGSARVPRRVRGPGRRRTSALRGVEAGRRVRRLRARLRHGEPQGAAPGP